MNIRHLPRIDKAFEPLPVRMEIGIGDSELPEDGAPAHGIVKFQQFSKMKLHGFTLFRHRWRRNGPAGQQFTALAENERISTWPARDATPSTPVSVIIRNTASAVNMIAVPRSFANRRDASSASEFPIRRTDITLFYGSSMTVIAATPSSNAPSRIVRKWRSLSAESSIRSHLQRDGRGHHPVDAERTISSAPRRIA